MAILIAGNTAIDSNDPDIGSLAFADGEIGTATYARFRTGLWIDEFYGHFQYDAFGDLAGGTLTGWKESYNGQLIFEVSGGQVSVEQFINWIAADANLTAAQTIFSGQDTMTGSAFGDRLSGWNGNDSILGGDGSDTLAGGEGADSVFGGLGDDVVTDTGGSNYLRGNEGNDSLQGGSGFDDVHGNQGNDTVAGGAGDDWVVGGQDNDLQYGGDGFDVVYGNLGADTLNGDAGNDWVRGGQQADVLNGGSGNDWLSGDRDNDTITGGAGADLFNLFDGSGTDRITDFSLAQGDRIRWEGGSPSNMIISQSGADTVISYNLTNSVTLVGVQMSTLQGSDWWVMG